MIAVDIAASDARTKGQHEAQHLGAMGSVFIGKSLAIRDIQSAINLTANSDTAVLIVGESGTGKEIVAHQIHFQSNRRDRPFIAVNCAALPKDIIENELFGHETGAFTGALVKKAGCFELADRGSLFFDELAEMTPSTQAKLLRAIETKSFRRLGGKEEISVDVRTIAATNKDIISALKTGELREDLYYRFSVIEIFIPPLRDRKEDIPLLVDHFLTLFSATYHKPRQHFSEECLEQLMNYDWPGNVRELRNVVEKSVIVSPDEVIGCEVLPQRLTGARQARNHVSIPLGSTLEAAEQSLILQTLEHTGNNKSETARILGLSRKALYDKLSRYDGKDKT